MYLFLKIINFWVNLLWIYYGIVFENIQYLSGVCIKSTNNKRELKICGFLLY